MRIFVFVLLTSLLAITAVISQSTQESPELKEATELTKSVVTLFNQQKFDDALVAAKRALEIRERLLPHTDARVVQSLGQLGDLYMARGDYDNGRITFERLLAIQEERFGPNDVNLAFVFERLAVLYYRDGKPDESEELYQRALAAREKAFGPENVEVADTLYALGQFYRIRRQYDRALASYKRSLMIYGPLKGVTSAEFQRASDGLECLGHETRNEAIFKERAAIHKQFAPALALARPAQVLNGIAIRLEKPEYPLGARNLKLSGTVVVRVEIDERGKVIGAKDVCQGLPYLSESAVEAALKARFTPTKISGKPVKVMGVIVYNFIAR